ncbi:CRISPR-associated endoribonuclease Cas6 [Marinitoga hydrogenitolerans DSM 16785]|uniref:CRISPR-associated endoribonuclease Cas6 n=1 Tax=Marinitoga hydrogenitolerans (strain DSM 16785 / JCM 12826 / AT1271) TaxID=1122195 RepID=A0A1M4Z3L1_MARH1|nr:CRISPR-associated endoribonuclease Cas6 [Marinitoga hydrogenitolerans]SHF12663.1 CRISPR-associated endoribonuclease Cas6 [Marinitoga hydrogenitolerans DSM 16785]
MRLKLIFKLKERKIPLDYRRLFLSFMKNALIKYDERIFKNYYNNNDPILKDYTFSLYFGRCNFKDSVILENNIISLFFSTYSYKTGVYFYNAFQNIKYYEYPLKDNSMILKQIIKLNEKSGLRNEIIVKTMSPIIIRNHTKEIDEYFYFDEKNASDILKRNIIYQYERIFNEKNKDIEIKVLDLKKITVLNYQKKLKANLGIFKLIGDAKILNFLYKTGIGSKKSSGFGMVKII